MMLSEIVNKVTEEISGKSLKHGIKYARSKISETIEERTKVKAVKRENESEYQLFVFCGGHPGFSYDQIAFRTIYTKK